VSQVGFAAAPLQPLTLQPLQLLLEPGPGALRPHIEAALAAHGRPLRWAVTAVLTTAEGKTALQIEAVVTNGVVGV